ncbi:MAG: DUF3189 family protein [Syntrophomonadaceae bacterium]|jgi:hypothetical protein|nr:DUF3189 family protein [Syntrophomonadaceae bacterium]
MKIIYHCFGGSHSSVTAAAIHLGLLPTNRLPSFRELMALPHFDKTPGEVYGVIRFMGRTAEGDEVYTLGKKNLGSRLDQVFMGLAELLGVKDQVVVVNTMHHVNVLMMAGGFLSRRLGLVSLGRPILVWGTRLAFPQLVQAVETVKNEMMRGEKE